MPQQPVVQFGETCPDTSDRQQLRWRTGNRAWEEWLSFAQGDGHNLNDGLVKETGIVQLTSKITAAHDQDVFSAGGFNHLSAESLDATLDEADFCARYAR